MTNRTGNPTAAALYLRFGRALRQRRKEVSLTQLALAGRVGLSRSAIAQIELGGQHVSLRMVYELADALGTDPVSLLPPVRRRVPLSAEMERILARHPHQHERQLAREFFEAERSRCATDGQ
ncbi:helix-turn-helix transcriptional regulator [Paraburkholderia sediminicola]|uniref:helix-turn-helix domain-containing protein n=1 Tax=Paraburkholderia sediminicola TaxID=458836 RepID=UPI0038BAE391